jgi:deoxyadenosine/deoxycytidine kinase
VIYLDAPVDKCLERIKQRGNANEIACVDEKYLGVMADSYKDALREFK